MIGKFIGFWLCVIALAVGWVFWVGLVKWDIPETRPHMSLPDKLSILPCYQHEFERGALTARQAQRKCFAELELSRVRQIEALHLFTR